MNAGLSQKVLGIRAGIDEFSASPRINQYERGRHTPNYATIAKLAGVLTLPVPFFYAQDDDLADLIRLVGRLSKRERKRVLVKMRRE